MHLYGKKTLLILWTKLVLHGDMADGLSWQGTSIKHCLNSQTFFSGLLWFSSVSNSFPVFNQRKALCHEQRGKRCHILVAKIRYQYLNNIKCSVQTKRDISDESSANTRPHIYCGHLQSHFGWNFFSLFDPSSPLYSASPKQSMMSDSSFWTLCM